MTTRISLFNHKGGVSKTTTTFNLGWMLALKGKKVIMVDTDPQCNLTGLVLGYQGIGEFERFYEDEKGRNIRDGLAPAFESKPKLLKPVKCVPVGIQQCHFEFYRREISEKLFLLPGHIRLSEYEVTLGIAQELSGSIQTLQNLPGSISYLLDETAKSLNADYVLIDMSPSLSAINQNLLMTSHYFIVPTNPSYFCVMAVESLTNILPKWHSWSQKAQTLPALKEAVYPFPKVTPKFLGTIIQKYQPYSGAPASSFQRWIDEIEKVITTKFHPALQERGMTLPEQAYNELDISNYSLSSIADFKSLIAKSEEAQTPIYALSPEQIGEAGTVLQNMKRRRDEFEQVFSSLAEKVINLTEYEIGN